MSRSPTVGKRLLVLGAGHYQIPLIHRAKELGCFVITADYLPANPGHRLADLALDVSTVDEEGILAEARRLQVDGVVTYGSDVSAPTVAYVADRLGLPGNPTAAGRLLQRKDLFRELQQRLGLPHPRFVAANEPAALAERIARGGLRWPILVKPADSSGSKGQSVLADGGAVPAAFHRASGFSRCGFVVAEELLEPDILELVGDVWIRDGRIGFRHYGHNYFVDEEPPRVPVGEYFPGEFSDGVADAIDRQLEAILEGTGVRTGCLNFDAFLADGQVHILDIGLRNGGNYLDDLIELSTGVDLTHAAIASALGFGFDCPALEVEGARPALSYVLNSPVAGRYRGVTLADELRPHLRRQIVFCRPGDPVEPFRRGDHALGVVLFTFPDMESLCAIRGRIPRLVRVLVDEVEGAAGSEHDRGGGEQAPESRGLGD